MFNLGWLEPLLSRIAEGKEHVVTPVIDNIRDENLQFVWFNPDQIHIGKFTWDLTFDWMPIPEKSNHNRVSNVSPVWLVNSSLLSLSVKHFASSSSTAVLPCNIPTF